MTLDELEVVITANSRQLQQELDRVRRSMETLERNTRRQTSQMEQSFNRVSRAVDKTGSSISKAMKALMGFVGLQQAFAAINAGIQSFATMESSAENIRRTLGSSSKQFMDWANTSASAFGLAKEDVMSYGNTLSLLVSSYEKNTDNIASITQNLLESTSVVASRSGRTIEDVLMRITSGMRGETEAIEDLGVFVQVSILSQTRAYQQYANGRHWDTLDERTKQQIRTAGILEQIMIKYGDTMAGGTMYSMLMFNASLKNLKTSLGEAFAPIYNVAVPALVTLMNALSKVLGYLSMFNKMIFGVKAVSPAKTDNKGLADALAQQQAVKTNQDGINKSLGQGASKAGGIGSGLGKAAKEAKKLRNVLMGFDEINLLNMPDDSVNGGAGGAGDLGGAGLGGDMTIPDYTPPEGDPTPPDWLIKLVDNIKGLFSDIFTPFQDAWNKYKGEFFASTKELLSGVATVTDSAWKTIRAIFKSDGYKQAVDGFVGAFVSGFGLLVDFLNATVVPVFKGFFDKLNPDNNPAVKKLLDSVGKLMQSFKQLVDLISDRLQPVFEKFKPILMWLGGFVADVFIEFLQTVIDAIQGAIDFVTGVLEGDWKKAFMGLAQVVYNVFMLLIGKWILKGLKLLKAPFEKLGSFFKSKFDEIPQALNSIEGALTSAARKVWDFVKQPFMAVGNWFKTKFDDIWKALSDIGETIYLKSLYVWDKVKAPFSAVASWFKTKFDDIWIALQSIGETMYLKSMYLWDRVKAPFVDVALWFRVKFDDIWKALQNIGETIYLKALYVWDRVKAPFLEVGNWFRSSFNQITDAMNNIRSSLGNAASSCWSAIQSPFRAVSNWFRDIFGSIVGVVKAPLNSIINMINGVINGLNKISFEIPDWVPAMGGKTFGINIPKVPHLAKGGIVDSAQMFVAGEAGKEVVMPLENNTGWITQLADKVSASMNGGNGSQQSYNDRPVEVTLQVGTTKLGRAVINSINQVQQQEGRLLLNL